MSYSINKNKLIKIFIYIYVFSLSLSPVFYSIRADYFLFFIILGYILFSEFKIIELKKSLAVIFFFIPLPIILSSFYLYIYQEGSLFYASLNLFGFFRVSIIFLFFIWVIKKKIISEVELFYLLFYSLLIIVLIGFLQTEVPSVNKIILNYYTSSYKEELISNIIDSYYVRPTSVVGHPSVFGLAILLSLSFLLFFKKNINFLIYIILFILFLYMGVLSGSKVFYIGVFILGVIFLFFKFNIIKFSFILSLIFFILLIYMNQIIYFINNEQLTYIFELVKNNGLFYILDTRFGEDGLLTTNTLPFLRETYYLGTGLFNNINAFYGDNLYLVLILRFSIFGMIVFIFYFLHFIYLLYKTKSTINQYIASNLLLMLVSGVGMASFFSTRIMEMIVIFWAIGFYNLYIKKGENVQIYKT